MPHKEIVRGHRAAGQTMLFLLRVWGIICRIKVYCHICEGGVYPFAGKVNNNG